MDSVKYLDLNSSKINIFIYSTLTRSSPENVDWSQFEDFTRCRDGQNGKITLKTITCTQTPVTF